MKILGIIVFVIIVLVILLMTYLKSRGAVPKDYTEKVQTGGEVEKTYLAMGKYGVTYVEIPALSSFEKYEIYYPEELTTTDKKYPVVIFCNGTGVKASSYKPLLQHLASWGFIVIGTEEEYSWNGFSAEMSARLIKKLQENKTYGDKDNPFYNKIDLNSVGITGHSQGGVGVFNAITENKNAGIYKCAVALSSTNQVLANGLEWEYDATKITIPTLLLSSTGSGDENLVINKEGLESIYNDINATKVMARRMNADHGDMLYVSDGYVTAWFMYYLQNDKNAEKLFQEIQKNILYQDQKFDIK
mgnify:FL=1